MLSITVAGDEQGTKLVIVDTPITVVVTVCVLTGGVCRGETELLDVG